MTSRLAVVPELERELEELYARPLDEFTHARNELARRLRSAGQAEAAERIKALKKPSVALWAVNQLARAHPRTVDELVSAGATLRKAQTAAFRGDADAVRRATADERRIARELTRQARELLSKGGHPATRPTLDRIAALLRSAAVDSDVARLLATGRLFEEVQSTGFEALAGIRVPKVRPPATRERSSPPVDRRREARLRRLQARLAELEEAAGSAEKEARGAERSAEKARGAADRAAAAVERARAALAAAGHGAGGSAA